MSKTATDTVKHKTNHIPQNRAEAEARGMKPWQPGKSGNPNGRPKNPDTLAFWLRQYGNLKLPKILPPQWDKSLVNWRAAGFPEPTTLIELEAVQLWADTLDGNDFSRREKNDRMYGKPKQEITGEDGGPLQVQTVVQFVGCGVKATE